MDKVSINMDLLFTNGRCYLESEEELNEVIKELDSKNINYIVEKIQDNDFLVKARGWLSWKNLFTTF